MDMLPSAARATVQRLGTSLAFGAEVSCSPAEVLRDTGLQQLVQGAFYEHGLLVFRNASLTPEEEVKFAKLFPWDSEVSIAECSGPYDSVEKSGVVGVSTNVDNGNLYSKASGLFSGKVGAARWKLPAWPEIQLQGSGKVHNHYDLADGMMTPSQSFCEWHTDGVHDTPSTTCPPVYTHMYCLSTPPSGAETLFASGCAAFRALPPSLQERACRLTAVYDGKFRKMLPSGLRALDTSSESTASTTNRWPVVCHSAPSDGKLSRPQSSLYVAPAFTSHLEEDGKPLPHAESQELLGEMLSVGLGLPLTWTVPANGSEPIQVPTGANVYAHAWRAGDFVIWNNHTMLHSATPTSRYVTSGGSRMVHRIRLSSQVRPVPPSSETRDLGVRVAGEETYRRHVLKRPAKSTTNRTDVIRRRDA